MNAILNGLQIYIFNFNTGDVRKFTLVNVTYIGKIPGKMGDFYISNSTYEDWGMNYQNTSLKMELGAG